MIIEKTKRFQWHRGSLFFNYRISEYVVYNKHLMEWMSGADVSFVSVGIDPDGLFYRETFEYEGTCRNSITVFGIRFSFGWYVYDNVLPNPKTDLLKSMLVVTALRAFPEKSKNQIKDEIDRILERTINGPKTSWIGKFLHRSDS